MNHKLIPSDELTGSQIEAMFRVYPESGEVERLDWDGEWKSVGWTKPGTISNGGGYRAINLRVNGKTKGIRLHRLVWMWIYGEWPKGEIDHINGNRADNRISNLRLVSISQNRTNKIKQSNNKSGFKWVYKCCQTGSYKGEVGYRDENGIKKRFRTSGHKTPDAAYEIASNFAKSVHGKFYNPGKK